MKFDFGKFIIICGAFFIFAPFFVMAQEQTWPLKQKQAIDILDIVRKYPITDSQRNFYDESLYNIISNYPAKTGAVMLVKQSILQEQLNYWFVKQQIELSKNLITAIYKLLPLVAYGDFSGAIDLIEKYTVSQANKYIDDWLAQNQVQIGSGIGKYDFQSYKGNWQVINIPYIIVYSPISATKGKVVVEFYSNKAIEPPEGRGSAESNFDWLTKSSWPRDRWLENEKQGNNDGKLEPFIVRVKGQVVKDKYGNFTWDKTAVDTECRQPCVEVEFGKPVPEISQADVILSGLQNQANQGFLQTKINQIKQTAQGIIDKVQQFFDIFSLTSPQAQISFYSNEGQTSVNLEEVRPPQDLQEIVERAEQIVNEENVVAVQQAVDQMQAKVEEVIIKSQATTTAQATSTSSGQATQKTICQTATEQEPDFDKVIFNEVAWMGSTKSSSDEWIELKNISVRQVDLNGWQIFNKSQGIKIFFTTTTIVAPGGFLLLERTNDDTVPNIKADLIYTGALANTDEALYLVGPNCVLQDKIKASPYWTEGDNTTKKTMERNKFFGWQTSSVVGGTPKAINSYGEIKSSGGGGSGATNNQLLITNNQNTTSSASSTQQATTTQQTATTTATSTQQATTTEQATTTQNTTTTEQATTTQSATSTQQVATTSQANLLDVVINEIAWMGTQASANHEWIELYNNTDQEINLAGWQIIGVGTNAISLTGEVSAGGFYLLERTASTTISDIIEDQIYTGALSNSGEKMELKDSQGNVIDIIDCSSGWFAGDNSASTSRKTMERKSTVISSNSQTNWASNNTQIKNGSDSLGNSILGTPKAQNSVVEISEASSVQTTTTQADDLPAITSLMAIPSPGRLAIDLLWLSPLNVLSYIIKMDDQEISQNIVPKPMGEVEFFNVANLQAGLKRYFSIKYTAQNGSTSFASGNISTMAWPGLVDNNDGTISDLRTNLTWHKNANAAENMDGASTTQYGAEAFVKNNFSEWRLANFKELASLFNYSNTTPSVWSGFENIVADKYWSKSKWEENFNSWSVNFLNGNVNYEHFWGREQSQFPFLTAQGQELPGGMINDNFNFTDNNDGTVNDNTTGLMWLRAGLAIVEDGGRLNWLNAFRYASNIALCNDGTLQGTVDVRGDCASNSGVKYDDWRLPNVQEMMEITKLGGSEILSWQSGNSFYYWTGSIADNNNFWWVGDGYNVGVVYPTSKDSRANVQLVREP